MKGTFFLVIIVIFSMLAIPLSALDIKQNTAMPTLKEQSNITYEKNNKVTGFEKIKVLKDGEIYEYSTKDYIFGVVAAEMPALYEKEALKAQAVAAYTFACYKKTTDANEQYDISADAKTAQCFITREEALSRWGEKAQEYTQKIDDCISAVEGEIITYNDSPIFAAYHAISPGKTNNCTDVWGDNLTYLTSVDSVGDTLADGYLSEVAYTSEELCEKLKSVSAAAGDSQNYFSNIETTNNGYVVKISYCGKTTTGPTLCELLGLRSSNFEIKYDNNIFTFIVKGYGHGVGMSQTGADYMAKQGSTYEEILLHYYNGASLQKN